MGKPSRVPERVLRWFLPALVAAFCGLAMATVTAVHKVAVQANEASRAALALARHRQEEGDDLPPRRTRRPEPAVAPLAPPPLRDAPVPPADPAGTPPIPSMASVLATLRPETHDPEELVRRAQKLREAGMDILLMRTELSRGLVSPEEQDLMGSSMRMHPVVRDGTTVGMRMFAVRPSSVPGFAGLQTGDVITSINGYPMNAPDTALTAYGSIQTSNTAAVELLREGRRILLVVGIPPAPQQARLKPSSRFPFPR
jgi:membrane-associated protease RseP (regulator of RpoE activity)